MKDSVSHTIKLDLFHIERYLNCLLLESEGRISGSSKMPGNACDTIDEAENQAVKDILQLIDLYGDDFRGHMGEILEKRTGNLRPEYDEAVDKANRDSWYISSYKRIFDRFLL